MTFSEELLLLLLDENSGYFVPVPEWKMACALAGAVLMDLALENRIDSDLNRIELLDDTPTGDEILDPVLAEVAAEQQTHTPQYWVERIAGRADAINDTAFDRLVDQGILDFESGGFWSLSSQVTRTGRYPLVDGAPGEEIKGRITRILLTDEIPDPRDIAIIGLLNCCDGVETLLEAEELEQAKARIELLSGMDLIGRTIGIAVRGSYRPPESLRTARRLPIPTIGLWQVLRSKSFRKGDLPRFMYEQTQIHGPIFNMRFFGNDVVVLGSAELNRWVGRKGRLHLRTRDYLQDFLKEWGASFSIASLDGSDHYRMRKTYREGCSRAIVESRMDEVFKLGRQAIAEWSLGEVVTCETVCQRLIGKQMSQLLLGFEPSSGAIHDLLKYEYRALLVHVFGILPKISLKTPRMKRYRANVMDLYSQIHASRTPAQREGKPKDLTDDVMTLHQADPQFLAETDLGFSFVAALIAGQYSGSALSFAIYEMLAHPEIHEKITAEADALFRNGDPTHEDFHPDRFDVTHRFIMETLRLHPVIPAHRRTAMNAFEFEGMEVPAYTTVLVGFTAPHFDGDLFKDPDKFDIDRYLPERNEHMQAGAYAPFGTGTHICLGRRWTEFQLVLNVLLIARHLDLEITPSNYKLKIDPFPKLAPAKSFKYRVTKHRHPLQLAED